MNILAEQENMLEQITRNSIIDSASRLCQAASLTSPPAMYGKLKNWWLDFEASGRPTSSDCEDEHCGTTKILKEVGLTFNITGPKSYRSIIDYISYMLHVLTVNQHYYRVSFYGCSLFTFSFSVHKA